MKKKRESNRESNVGTRGSAMNDRAKEFCEKDIVFMGSDEKRHPLGRYLL